MPTRAKAYGVGLFLGPLFVRAVTVLVATDPLLTLLVVVDLDLA